MTELVLVPSSGSVAESICTQQCQWQHVPSLVISILFLHLTQKMKSLDMNESHSENDFMLSQNTFYVFLVRFFSDGNETTFLFHIFTKCDL